MQQAIDPRSASKAPQFRGGTGCAVVGPVRLLSTLVSVLALIVSTWALSATPVAAQKLPTSPTQPVIGQPLTPTQPVVPGTAQPTLPLPGQPTLPVASLASPRLAMESHRWDMLTEGTNGYQAAGGFSHPLGAFQVGDTSHSVVAADTIGADLGQIVISADGGCPNALSHVEITIEGIGPAGGVNSSVFADPTATEISFPVLLSQFSGIASAEDSHGNTCGDLEVSWFAGNQQVMSFEVPIAGLDQTACSNGSHQVLFNGQQALLYWQDSSLRCLAGLSNLYFPARSVVSTAAPATDHTMWVNHYPTLELGPGADLMTIEASFDMHFSSYPYGGLFFDNDSEADDVRVRPLLVELGVLNGVTLEIIDRARIMFWENGLGKMSMLGAGEHPSASATLTPAGLDTLEEVHHTMIPPTPVLSADFETRVRSHDWDPESFEDAIVVPLTDLSLDDQAYFTGGIAPDGNTYEWRGSAAYADITTQADGKYLRYQIALAACRATGRTNCETLLTPFFCVRDDVGSEDFNLRVTGVSTRFSQTQPQTIGNFGEADLSFRDAPDVGVMSATVVQTLQTSIEGDLMPHVTIEYKRACSWNVDSPPDPRPLATQISAEVDPAGWASCTSMMLHGSAMALENDYMLVANGDALDTVHQASRGDWAFALPDLANSGTCFATWIDPVGNTSCRLFKPGKARSISRQGRCTYWRRPNRSIGCSRR